MLGCIAWRRTHGRDAPEDHPGGRRPAIERVPRRTRAPLPRNESNPDSPAVRIHLAQHGWQEGEDWDEGYAYFDQAWSWVLDTMKKTLEAP